MSERRSHRTIRARRPRRPETYLEGEGLTAETRRWRVPERRGRPRRALFADGDRSQPGKRCFSTQDGKPEARWPASLDITERKRAEEALRSKRNAYGSPSMRSWPPGIGIFRSGTVKVERNIAEISAMASRRLSRAIGLGLRTFCKPTFVPQRKGAEANRRSLAEIPRRNSARRSEGPSTLAGSRGRFERDNEERPIPLTV